MGYSNFRRAITETIFAQEIDMDHLSRANGRSTFSKRSATTDQLRLSTGIRSK